MIMRRVVVLGAHPDDAESGCGGLIANLTERGVQVEILCMTRGEKAPGHNPPGLNARMRTEEARQGAEILGAGLGFLGFIDGEVVADGPSHMVVEKAIVERKPDILLAHWPVDTHLDHQAAGILAIRTLIRNPSFALYFFEVLTGIQTMNFVPTHYVDISGNRERKLAACMAHRSQRPEDWTEKHQLMERFRGRETGVEYAEAYVRSSRSPLDSPAIT